VNKYVFFLFIINLNLVAQSKSDALTIHTVLQFNNADIELNKNYVSTTNDTLSFETIKFYLTDFQIHYKDNSIYKETNSYHLVDIEKPEALNFTLNNMHSKKIESIQFNIGVDSLANVSGANGGDLDLQNGMYWAWQSGYINMKIEGTSKSCATRKNKFHFHIGGYLNPNYAIRKVEIPINKSQIPNKEINLVMDLGLLFSKIHLKETNTIMIPGNEAMKMADLLTTIFSIE
jgi:hypothetical protein